MKYYQASIPIQTTPKDGYSQQLQQLINAQWDNTSTLYTIQEELDVGSKVYTNTEVQIVHIIQSDTGSKRPDDFKEIIFKDLDHARGLGYHYQFDDNTWLTISTDFYKYVTASSVIRRCNNILKWINDGQIVSCPCIIDYDVTFTTPDYKTEISLPKGVIRVWSQANDLTNQIGINKRFLFGNTYQAWKVQSVNNFLSYNTESRNAPILSFDMYIDELFATDDLVNGIANNEGIVSNGSVVIDPIVSRLTQGQTQVYSVYSYINDLQQVETFTVSASGVPSSLYILTQIDGNHFSIKNVGRYDISHLAVHCVGSAESDYNFEIELAGLF